ncbi:MAG: hypothetical protein ACLFRP_01840 [Puniceicoccaceae bacterium]
MSIINEALKKARREGTPAGAPPAEETLIHPRRRSSSGPGIWMILSAVLVVIAFVALVGGLGYFVYTQYFRPAEAAEPAPARSEMAASPEEEEDPPPEEPEKPAPAGTLAVGSSAAPENERRGETPEPPPAGRPAAIPATEEILSQFTVNGVMRGGASVRVLTNSGVYRVGDVVRSPPGFRIQSIEEDSLLLLAPDGNSHRIPLP